MPSTQSQQCSSVFFLEISCSCPNLLLGLLPEAEAEGAQPRARRRGPSPRDVRREAGPGVLGLALRVTAASPALHPSAPPRVTHRAAKPHPAARRARARMRTHDLPTALWPRPSRVGRRERWPFSRLPTLPADGVRAFPGHRRDGREDEQPGNQEAQEPSGHITEPRAPAPGGLSDTNPQTPPRLHPPL